MLELAGTRRSRRRRPLARAAAAGDGAAARVANGLPQRIPVCRHYWNITATGGDESANAARWWRRPRGPVLDLPTTTRGKREEWRRRYYVDSTQSNPGALRVLNATHDLTCVEATRATLLSPSTASSTTTPPTRTSRLRRAPIRGARGAHAEPEAYRWGRRARERDFPEPANASASVASVSAARLRRCQQPAEEPHCAALSLLSLVLCHRLPAKDAGSIQRAFDKEAAPRCCGLIFHRPRSGLVEARPRKLAAFSSCTSSFFVEPLDHEAERSRATRAAARPGRTGPASSATRAALVFPPRLCPASAHPLPVDALPSRPSSPPPSCPLQCHPPAAAAPPRADGRSVCNPSLSASRAKSTSLQRLPAGAPSKRPAELAHRAQSSSTSCASTACSWLRAFFVRRTSWSFSELVKDEIEFTFVSMPIGHGGNLAARRGAVIRASAAAR